MKKSKITVFVLLLLAKASVASTRPLVGLALSGGGARAFTHIGILKVLKQNHIPIDYVAGTSMGALIGALYSIGYSPEEIEDIFIHTPWPSVLNDDLTRKNYVFHKKDDHHKYLFDFEVGLNEGRVGIPNAVVTGHRLSAFLQSLTYFTFDVNDFYKFPLPFAAYATDIESGKPILLRQGNLGQMLYASMAYPGYVAPAKVENRSLIDGYFSNNLPVKQLKEMGANYIIAVDVSFPIYKVEKLKGFLSVADQATNILVKRNMQEDLRAADLVLSPDIGDISSTNFDYPDYFIRTGEEYAQTALKPAGKVQVSPADYARFDENRSAMKKSARSIKVDNILVSSASTVNRKFILRKININPGEEFLPKAIDANLNDIFGWGDFEKIEYWLNRENDKNTLNIYPKEKSWGPNYLRFGIAFDTEIKSSNQFIGMASYTMNYINRLGAIWKNEIFLGNLLGFYSEFYQPITYGSPFFMKWSGSIARSDQSLFFNKDLVDQYEINRSRGDLKFGVNVGKNIEFSLGTFSSWVDASPDLPSTNAPKNNFYFMGLNASLILDSLDQRNFPTNGIFFSANLDNSYQMKSAFKYQKLSSTMEQYFPLWQGSLFYRLQGGVSFAEDLPFFDQFVLGGSDSFSGFRREERRGDYLTLGRLGYSMPLTQSSTFLFRGVNLSVFGDVGNTWGSASDIEVHQMKVGGGIQIGLDTKLAPIYLGYGQQGKSSFQVYFKLGANIERKSM